MDYKRPGNIVFFLKTNSSQEGTFACRLLGKE